MRILITGCAGFIGYHLSLQLLQSNHIILGIDNMNKYYDIKLKKKRLLNLKKNKNFTFNKIDITDYKNLIKLKKYKIDKVINLAAQAGVRYSIKNPDEFIQTNVLGFHNILKFGKENKIKHLVYASSSSVYGDNNKKNLFIESDKISKHKSIYGFTKYSNEKMADVYNELYKMKITGLRFFTVFGKFGRPDMAIFNFVDSILKDKQVKLYNYGNNVRDFTYVGDLVKMIKLIVESNIYKRYEHEVYNLGSSNPYKVSKLIEILGEISNKKIKIKKIPSQLGDVKKTGASIKKFNKVYGKIKMTNLNEALKRYFLWHKEFYK
jgi:UDP-glucuronate 4-epimerase